MLKVFGVIVFAVAWIYFYNVYNYPDYSYRYKMTVEVETPEGVKSGSSVIEVTTSQWPKWLAHLFGGHTSNSRAYGEAPFVDLGDRGILFTAFRGSYSERLYPRVFIEKTNAMIPHGGVPEFAKVKDFMAELSEGDYPTLVVFDNLDDPKTISTVNPEEFSNAYGEGVFLKSIFVKATDHPLEWKVEKRLPSFGKETGYAEWYRSLKYGDPRQLDRSVFIKKRSN